MAETKQLQLPGWIASHLQEYLDSNGAQGHIWHGVPTLLLTTTGRKSGTLQTLPLLYGRNGEDYVIVASKGGAPDHPGWYKNLVKEPEVGLQVGSERFSARARTTTGSERERLWQEMAKIWPSYNDYQKSTPREIPVIVVERI